MYETGWADLATVSIVILAIIAGSFWTGRIAGRREGREAAEAASQSRITSMVRSGEIVTGRK